MIYGMPKKRLLELRDARVERLIDEQKDMEKMQREQEVEQERMQREQEREAARKGPPQRRYSPTDVNNKPTPMPTPSPYEMEMLEDAIEELS